MVACHARADRAMSSGYEQQRRGGGAGGIDRLDSGDGAMIGWWARLDFESEGGGGPSFIHAVVSGKRRLGLFGPGFDELVP